MNSMNGPDVEIPRPLDLDAHEMVWNHVEVNYAMKSNRITLVPDHFVPSRTELSRSFSMVST